MNCPTERGGCGAKLQWEDGAFCASCMTQAIEKLRKEEVAAKFKEETGKDCTVEGTLIAYDIANSDDSTVYFKNDDEKYPLDDEDIDPDYGLDEIKFKK